MQRKLLTPPRLVIAAVLSLGGLVAGAAAPTPAQAGDCTTVSVWVYRSWQGRDHVVGPAQCTGVTTPWRNGRTIGHDTGTDGPPYGTPTGVGFEISTI